MINRPIVIIHLPRSGSSMVAGIFAHHGVFAGTCKDADSRNAKGFFEHVGFTKLVLDLYSGGKISRGEPVRPHPGFKRKMLALLEEDGYEKGPWMIKHAHVYYRIWEEGFEPRFVLIRRDTAAIKESAERCGWKTSHIIGGQQTLDRLAEEFGAPQVISDELVSGNYDSICRAFDYCGLDFDEKVAAAFIDPSLWRHGVKSLVDDNSVVMRDKNYLKPNWRKGQKHA